MGLKLALVLVLVCALWSRTMAQLSCTTAIVGLAPCLNYISGNSSTPASSCCSQFASVASSQPQCLCLVVSNGFSIAGIGINQTRALALPGACNVQIPPASRCNSGGAPTISPVASPAVSPAVHPSETPAVSPPVHPSKSPAAPSPSLAPSTLSVPSTSRNGSKTTPSQGGHSSSGSVMNLPHPMLFFMVFIASSASVLNSF